MKHPMRRGMTLTEIAVATTAVLIGALLLMWVLQIFSTARPTGPRRPRDSTHLRGILQGMVLWADSHEDRYPLPSLLDLSNETTSQSGAEKDTTANILSILVMNGFLPAEMLVSPNESSDLVQEYGHYEFESPSAAVDPARAVWDPALHGTPSPNDNGGRHVSRFNPLGISNNSYAHLPPFGRRNANWSLTFDSTMPQVANRGPECEWDDTSWVLSDGPTGTRSSTLLFHGSARSWEGHVGYADNRVAYEYRPDPEHVMFEFLGLEPPGAIRPDNLFVNESDVTGLPDDPRLNPGAPNINAYLRPYSAVHGKNPMTAQIDPWVD